MCKKISITRLGAFFNLYTHTVTSIKLHLLENNTFLKNLKSYRTSLLSFLVKIIDKGILFYIFFHMGWYVRTNSGDFKPRKIIWRDVMFLLLFNWLISWNTNYVSNSPCIPVYQLFSSSKRLHFYADITISDEGLYLFATNNWYPVE